MASMGQYTLEQLEKIVGLIPGSQLMGWHKQAYVAPKQILPAGIEVREEPPEERVILPNLVATCAGRKVSVEFSPAPHPENWWMNMYVSGSLKVLFSLTAADTTWFTRGGLVPQFDIPTGDELFDSQYSALSSKPDEAKEFLRDKKQRDLISSIGKFARFTADRRFVRVTWLVDDQSLVEANSLKKTIEQIVELAADIERWQSVAESN